MVDANPPTLPVTPLATTILVAGTLIGATTQHFASADVSSGDRPVLVPIDTCRIADTRAAPDNVGPRSTPLGPAETITIDAQQVGTDCTGQIPASATALSLNVTALNATSNSFLTVWSDGPRPTASALNPEPGTHVFNAVTTEVTATQTFQIYNNRGNVDVFVDINGYYDNHNHDDLYYTQSQVDANFVNQNDAPEMYYAIVNSGGAIVRSSPGVSVNYGGAGTNHIFTFPRDITTCFWGATLGGAQLLDNSLPLSNDLGIAASQNYDGTALDPDAIIVTVYDAGGLVAVSPFTLTVTCP